MHAIHAVYSETVQSWQKELQCDAIRQEQFETWHFSRGYNFWTNDLILILKTPTRP